MANNNILEQLYLKCTNKDKSKHLFIFSLDMKEKLKNITEYKNIKVKYSNLVPKNSGAIMPCLW